MIKETKYEKIDPINILQLTIGSSILLIGLLIYLFDRQLGPDQIFFTFHLRLPNYSHLEYNRIFGKLGNNLPSFIHVCSFSLLTSTLLPSRSKLKCLKICIGWAFIDILFEFGQLLKLSIIPSIFKDNKLFIQINNYFKFGTFDYLDILFSLFGCLFAYLIIIITWKGGANED